MLLDELTVYLKSGNGGDGAVRWRHEKNREFGGPSGGDGGKGGDVLVEAVNDILILARYKHLKKISAENGQNGISDSRHGKDGKDLIFKLPVGTIITNLTSGKKYSLDRENQIIKILKGGRGGLGNESFKSSVNIRPSEHTAGKKGEESDFLIELELIADAGFIGMPNAGKTSLLNILSGGEYKTGDYQFTTLSPNLGAVGGLILADIPGLIEDSSVGKGLGIKFLKHIKRTKSIIHCISSDNENIIKAYKTIRKELKHYNPELMQKPEFIIITKSDLVSKDKLLQIIKDLKKETKLEILSSSILDDDSIKQLKSDILNILNPLEVKRDNSLC